MAQKATPRKATPERELPTLSKKDTRKKSTPMKAKPKERHLEKGKGAPIGPSSSWVRTADEPIFLIRASCRVKYSESFRFTPRSERRLTAKSIRKRKRFYKTLGLEKKDVSHFYLYNPLKYNLISSAYMRLHPKDLKTVLKDEVVRYVYVVEHVKVGGKGGTERIIDIVLSDTRMMGTEDNPVPCGTAGSSIRRRCQEGGLIVLAEATSEWQYSETFRFTTVRLRPITARSISTPQKFHRAIGHPRGDVNHFFLHGPLKYSLLNTAYMRMHPEDLGAVLDDNVVKYIYVIGYDEEDEASGTTRKTWDVVFTDSPVVDREEWYEENKPEKASEKTGFEKPGSKKNAVAEEERTQDETPKKGGKKPDTTKRNGENNETEPTTLPTKRKSIGSEKEEQGPSKKRKSTANKDGEETPKKTKAVERGNVDTQKTPPKRKKVGSGGQGEVEGEEEVVVEAPARKRRSTGKK